MTARAVQQEHRQYRTAQEVEGVKAPKSTIFAMPHESNLARMPRDDLAEARKQWLSEAKNNPQQYAHREQSDFLSDTNHEGEVFDFHCLRHTCGAWLALAGAHPKGVQQVMRHQSITLTMDTYGHLFPGQEADAVGRLRSMLSQATDSLPPEAVRATGTDDLSIVDAEGAQRTSRETRRTAATDCDAPSEGNTREESPKPMRTEDLGDDMRDSAIDCPSSGGGTRNTHHFPGKNESVASLQTITRPSEAARCGEFLWLSRTVASAPHVACPRRCGR